MTSQPTFFKTWSKQIPTGQVYAPGTAVKHIPRRREIIDMGFTTLASAVDLAALSLAMQRTQIVRKKKFQLSRKEGLR
jgi:hypothetical protein